MIRRDDTDAGRVCRSICAAFSRLKPVSSRLNIGPARPERWTRAHQAEPWRVVVGVRLLLLSRPGLRGKAVWELLLAVSGYLAVAERWRGPTWRVSLEHGFRCSVSLWLRRVVTKTGKRALPTTSPLPFLFSHNATHLFRYMVPRIWPSTLRWWKKKTGAILSQRPQC
jgi:hypothetical protein